MPLWTDIMDPVEATGIARAAQYEIERSRAGSLARYLPNVDVASQYVDFVAGDTGLVDVAHYRAFNSPPKIGAPQGGELRTIKLPAISRDEPINEQAQMTWEHLSPERQYQSIEKAIKRNVQAISDRQELTRGIAIETGKAYWVDNVANGGPADYILNDDFQRNPALDITAPALWSAAGTDIISQLMTWADTYAQYNGGNRPGAIRISPQAFAALSRQAQFATTLQGGATRPGLRADIEGLLTSAGLPPVDMYDRQVMVNGVMRRVLDPTKIEFLPEATDPNNEEGTILGATFWGLTRSAQRPSWGIEPDEQPGIVCGVFSDEKVGDAIEVQGDSMGEPVLRNANATMTVKVL